MAENASQEKGEPKSRKRRILPWILVGLIVVIVLLFLGTPMFLSSAAGKNFLVSRINQSVDGQVKMDDLSIGWFKGVRVQNMTFDDNAGNTSIQVKSLAAQPQFGALLGGRVKLGKTVIENPRVYVKVLPPEQRVPREKGEKPKEEGRVEMPINQIDLQIVDGQATIEMTGQQPQKVSFTNIASNVVVSESDKPSTLAFSMQVQDGQTPGTVEANGTAVAEKNWTIKDGQFNVKISKLQLESLKPLLALAGQSLDMSGELNADAQAQIANNKLERLTANAVVTEFAQGTGAQRRAFTEPVRLTAQVGQQGNTLRIDKLNLQSGFFTLDSSGTLENLDFNVQTQDLAQVQKFAAQFADLGGLAMQGQAGIKGNLKITDEAITVNSQGTAQQMVVAKEGVRTPATDAQLNLEASYLRKQQELRVPAMNLTSTPATLKVSNLVYPLGAAPGQARTMSLDAVTQADLAQVWPFVQVFAKTPEGMKIAGQLNAGVKVATTGNQIHLTTQDAAINKLSISQPNSQPFVQDKVSLQADILMDTQDKTIDVKALNLRGAQGEQLIEVTKGTVDRTVSQNDTVLKGDFQASYDLKALTSFAAAFMPQGLTMEGQRKAFFKFESAYPTQKPELLMANLNGSGNFGFDRANFMGLKFGATDLNLNINKGLMLLELPDAKVNEGVLRLSASINMADPKRTLQLTKPMKVLDGIHLDDEVTKKLLTSLNPMFANQTNITGIASLECRKLVLPLASPMDKAAILLDSTVAMSNVNLKPTGLVGQILTLVESKGSYNAELKPTQVQMSQGTLQYKDMEFVLEQYPIGFSGRILLAQAEPAADLTVAVPYTVEGKAVHTTDDLSTRLTVPLKGPLAKLKLDLGSLLKQGLQQQLQQQLKKQVPGLENIPLDIFK
ncbi:MAG: hypothetical protein LLF76_13030 [Planctomycetaceae bacterium]|nr:hypothetical protein [Planctomycetaceae bacterium]